MSSPRTRREPPPFRRVEVRRIDALSPWMRRVTLGGPELDGFQVEQPAASVRLLLPSPRANALVVPEWSGNEFLLPDGARPLIRTFTPRRVDVAELELDLHVVLHEGGLASTWAEHASPGAEAAVSGPGRGYEIDDEADAFLLAGDETAIPAMGQLLEVLPPSSPVSVLVEVAHADAPLPLPEHAGASVQWHELPDGADPGAALVAAVADTDLPDGVRVWAAGEAAAMQQIRRHLFEDRGFSRSRTTVRGYWKNGRSGH